MLFYGIFVRYGIPDRRFRDLGLGGGVSGLWDLNRFLEKELGEALV